MSLRFLQASHVPIRVSYIPSMLFLQRWVVSPHLEKIKIEREIRNTVNNLHSSLKRLQLLIKNVELAERNFEISRQRFSNGDIDAQTLALDRVRLNDAYNSRLEAYISYKLHISDLTRKTFYDFEKGVILAE